MTYTTQIASRPAPNRPDQATAGGAGEPPALVPPAALSRDDLGDRMKDYEARESDRRFLPMLPVYARLDGRCFSSFTRGLARPYDLAFMTAMHETTAHLIEETHALIGYTQSDEINLVWLQEDSKSEIFFAGRIQKMTSVLAAVATAAFFRACYRFGLAERADRLLPGFDCRVFQLPSRTEAANVFLWRELDAAKNSVSMLARAHYGPAELHGKKAAEMHDMLHEKGINWNDFPTHFKRGAWFRRVTRERCLSETERLRIPEPSRPLPGATFLRSKVEGVGMPIFSTVTNRVEVIFDAAKPVTA